MGQHNLEQNNSCIVLLWNDKEQNRKLYSQ